MVTSAPTPVTTTVTDILQATNTATPSAGDDSTSATSTVIDNSKGSITATSSGGSFQAGITTVSPKQYVKADASTTTDALEEDDLLSGASPRGISMTLFVLVNVG